MADETPSPDSQASPQIAVQSTETASGRKRNTEGLNSFSAGFDSQDINKGVGALAKSFFPKDAKTKQQEIDIVGGYPWTLSKLDVGSVPFILLTEYQQTEATIMKQLSFSYQVTKDKAGNAVSAATGLDAKTKETLSIYDEIYPKNKRTPWSYRFPYFNDTAFSLGTAPWTKLDGIGKKVAGAVESAAKAVDKVTGTKVASDTYEAGAAVLGAAGAMMDVALEMGYPAVGIPDRPKIFTAHNERSITIEFPLFNTINAADYVKNRDFIYLFMSQNLFNKRDLITGLPPVFYEVEIPGQYFSIASSVTNIEVKNLGNQRIVDGAYIVPDAYQVAITLQELAMPSKNQFEYLISQQSSPKVSTK